MNNECNRPLSGITCTACNCIHHIESDLCCAEHINVANERANTPDDTACKSFVCRPGCSCR